MIQLANDPNASRMGSRPAQSDGKGRSLEHARSRGGHAWPFISRHSGRTAPSAASRSPSSSDSVS
ncbi:hypothetical protein ACFPOE_02570 [Caenimonas terrae]|uniref:Uncharacterized protein n=1 Tax=Caenimonas terrae TaxID=696074 RepID=A0ABW0NB72_9BURK